VLPGDAEEVAAVVKAAKRADVTVSRRVV